MISFEKALEIVLENAFPVGYERISFDHALNRVLGEAVAADRDMPPFHKSAVDGYACIDPQDGQQLKVLEQIAAGQAPSQALKPGTCSRIMTGAEVPENTTHVVMIEQTEEVDEHNVKLVEPGSKTNIALKGEDFKIGDPVMAAGTYLQPQHIAILAGVGHTRPLVAERPGVKLITTGNELVEPDQQPSASQIRNTNAPQLMAQFRQMGITPHYSGIIGDSANDLLREIESGVAHHHLTVLTGGVSMGDYDYVPDMMINAGVEILFHKIAMKPGKPTIFGRKGDNLIIGLPGNPVSTFLQFELLIKPLLYKLMGGEYHPASLKMSLGEEIRQKKSDRDSWKPVRFEQGAVYPVSYHGSGHIHALLKAQGFLCVPAGETQLKKGAIVDVRQV
jgi:molybdopterin molybdotransferase